MENINENSIVKVSVIVPVYKVEAYIERCLDALQNQTLKDIEMIFIDDCGGDNAIKFVEKRAKNDSRITIIYNEENIGSGKSRNKGIEIACGKYLGFIDADDSIDLDFYETLYNLAEKHQCDVAKGACKQVYANETKTSAMFRTFKNFPECSVRDDWHTLFLFEHWSAIYLSEMIKKNGARYGETSTGQDAVFLLSAMYNARKVAFTYDTYYYYHRRQGTLDTTRTKEFFTAKIQVYKDFVDFFNKNDGDVELKCKALAIRFGTTMHPYYGSLLKKYRDDVDFQTEFLSEIRNTISKFTHCDLLCRQIISDPKWSKILPAIMNGNMTEAIELLKRMFTKVSVIVPVYNAENTIRRCVDSVLNQNFEVELICVDDCSTDSSYYILLDYAEKDDRVRVIKNTENLKAGMSRNKGIDAADGEYLYFLDADDYMAEGALKKLYNDAHANNLDIIKAKAVNMDMMTNEKASPNAFTLNTLKWFPKNLFNKVINFHENALVFRKVSVAPWSGMYKKDFINQNNIRFNNLICVNDRSFSITAMVRARRIMVADYNIVYHFVNNPNSLVGVRMKNFNCQFESYRIIVSAISDLRDEYKYRIMDAELSDTYGWFSKITEIDDYNEIYGQIKLFSEEIDIPFLEKNAEALGEKLSDKAWYLIYTDIMNLSSQEYLKKNRLKMHRKNNDNEYDVKISVIIPVYNVEEYIENCINSIIYQTLDDIEIICVDDCSTDNSLQILERLSQEDPRIKVISFSENKSASQARKDGVMAACGKYILFVDADDALKPASLESLYNEMESNPVDILHFGTDIINDGNLPQARIDNMIKFVKPFNGTLNGFDVFEKCFDSKSYRFSLWNKMYDASLCKLAFSYIKDGSFPKAQDLYAYFVLSFFAESYRGIPNQTYYEYHFGRGVTGHNFLDMDLFERYCQMGLVANAIHIFLEEQGYDEVFNDAYQKTRSALVNDCVSQWNKSLSNSDKLIGYEMMVKYFNPSEIIARIVAINTEDQAQIAKMLLGSHTLDVKKTKINTIGMHYFRLANGGIQRVISLLADLYIKLGYNVVIFCDEKPTENAYDLPENVEVVTLPGVCKSFDNLNIHLNALYIELQKHDIDVMLFHGWNDFFGLLAQIVTVKSLGIPFIMHCHNVFTVPMLKSLMFFSDMPYIYSLCDQIVVLSETDKEYWQQFNDNVTIVRNPLTFNINEIELAPLQTKNVVWLARVASEKKPYDPIDIFKLVVKKIPDAKLYYVGSAKTDSEMNDVRAYIKANDLSDNIIVTGFVKDVDTYYRDSSVFLCTSLYEGFLMTLLEGQSFGLPTVMYDMPWLTLTEGNHGIVSVAQDDKENAANAIIELLSNDELRIEMGRQAREHVEKFADYDYKGIWSSILNSVLNLSERKQLPKYKSVMFETLYSHYKYHINEVRKLHGPNDKIKISSTEKLTETEMIEKLQWNRAALRDAQQKLKNKGIPINPKDYPDYKNLKNDFDKNKNELQKLKNEFEKNKKDLQKNKSELSKKKQECQKFREQADFYRSELDGTRNSLSFKIARFITWLPRKIRRLFGGK